MAKITYANKVNIVTQPVPEANKVTAENMNEIKASVNQNVDDIALKANINGNELELFKVAPATLSTHAISKAQLDAVITAFSGALIPQGNWNASTNTPDISATTQTGYYWIVSVNGSTDIGGITDWVVNDWVVKTADGWAKIDNTDKVTSVNGETGAITNVAKTDAANTFTQLNTFNDETWLEEVKLKPFVGDISILRFYESNLTTQRAYIAINSAGTSLGSKGLWMVSGGYGFYVNSDDNKIYYKFNNLTNYEIYHQNNLTKAVIEALAISASSLTGTLADVRLSSNVVLLNNAQTITGVKTFSSAIIGNLTGNATTASNASNASLINSVSAPNLSQGESYARIKQRYFLDNAYTVYPTDAGFQYAKLLQANLLRNASIFILPQATKTGLLGAEKGADLDVVRATTATYADENGVIQTALANVPRIDFTNGTGSILVEPQRTNLLLRSEEFDNASWVKSGISVTANTTIAPNGTTTADLLTSDNIGSFGRIQQTLSVSGAITFSLFVKQNTANLVTLYLTGTGIGAELGVNLIYDFNFTTNTLVKNASSSSTATSTKVENFDNNWKRISVTVSSTTITDVRIYSNWATINNFSSFIWGAQLEQGSNASSYIPTVASTVTRNADAISKTGISNLINSSEGTIIFTGKPFVDNAALRSISLSDGTTNNVVFIQYTNSLRTIQGRVIASGNVYFVNYTFPTTELFLQEKEIAFTYKLNEIKIIVNGVQVAINTNVPNLPVGLSRLGLNRETGGQPFEGELKNLIIKKTAI